MIIAIANQRGGIEKQLRPRPLLQDWLGKGTRCWGSASIPREILHGLGYNLVASANIVGLQRVADAMMTQGSF